MLKDIAGIRVCGANFENSSDILFLDPHYGNKIKKVKGSLLYGRNGAGKSTLAKAVKSAKGEVQEAIIQADFLDSNNSPFELTPEDLLSHLEGCTDIESNLQHWCNDIKNSCLM